MAATMGTGRGMSADINVTPLIDVLLVLLITFMVITPSTPKGLDALIPQSATNERRQPETAIVVQLLKSNGTRPSLKINREDATWEGLQQRLTDIFKLRAERMMFVKGDNDRDFASVAEVIDIAHAASVDKVGIFTAKVAGE